MEKFVFKRNTIIPDERLKDVQKLREFIVVEMGIDISLIDTYLFWNAVSDSWSAGWLYIDTKYDDMTREEFLRYQMEKFGSIVDF